MANRVITIAPSGGTYTTLSLALAGEADFQAGEDNIVFQYAGVVVDSSAINISRYTTSAAHRIIIEVPVAYRNDLTLGTGARIACDAGWSRSLTISIPYVHVIGLSIHNASSNARGLNINGANAVLDSCLIAENSTQGELSAVYIYQNNVIIANCAIYGLYNGIYAYLSGTIAYAYNNTILNSLNRGLTAGGWCTLNAINNYVGGSAVADYARDSGATLNITSCRSSDGSMSTSIVSLANCGFTSYTAGSEDVHIGSGSSLINIGTDLSSDSIYPINYDALGNNRSGLWDIGAVESVSAGPFLPAILNHYRNMGVV